MIRWGEGTGGGSWCRSCPASACLPDSNRTACRKRLSPCRRRSTSIRYARRDLPRISSLSGQDGRLRCKDMAAHRRHCKSALKHPLFLTVFSYRSEEHTSELQSPYVISY